MFRHILHAVAILPLTLFPAVADDDHTHSEHAALPGIETGHGWMAQPSGTTARVFVRIENQGDVPINLSALQTDIGTATLMAPPLTGGDAVPLGAYPMEPGTRLDMAPDGIFVFIEGIATPLAIGDMVEMELTLEPLGEMHVDVEVEGPDAESDSHIGHDH